MDFLLGLLDLQGLVMSEVDGNDIFGGAQSLSKESSGLTPLDDPWGYEESLSV